MQQSDGEKKTVLVVDDEEALREIVAEELGDFAGYRIVQACNGKQALEVMEKEKPDCIVTDINMPEMTGIEMLESMRAKGIKTPVIIVTGFGSTDAMKKAWKWGAFDFVDKPIRFEVLKNIVKNAILLGEKHLEGATSFLELPTPIYKDLLLKAKENSQSPAEFIQKCLK